MYLACGVCGDNGLFTREFMSYEADKAVAHRQCARNAEALKSDEGEDLSRVAWGFIC